MSTNAELMERVDAVFGRMGVSKAADVMTTANMQTGQFMNRKQVEELVDLTVGQSGWLSAITTKVRNQRAGEIPRLLLSGNVTEGVPENAGETIGTKPTTDNVSYDCKKFQATWHMTLEDVREAAASGESQFEEKVRGAFAKAVGNDMATWVLQGDTTLNALSRRNRLLRQQDGILKKARSGANYDTTTYGSAYAVGVYSAMLARMPDEYAEDPNLRWLIPRKLDMSFTDFLQGSGMGAGDLRDSATVERKRFTPHGIPPLILPQLPTTQGFDTLTGAAAAPDVATDDTDGTATFRVSAVLGGAAAGNAGRRVTVTCVSTGQSETLEVQWESSQNVVHSVGSLGQVTISETEADYLVDVADTVPMLLTNPANLCLVICDQIRAYRKWEQEFERWRFDLFYEADDIIFNDDAMVLQEGIVPTVFSFGS